MRVVCKHIYKSYGATDVLQDVNITVEDGSFFALIGANGAGKSTLIDIMTKRISADSGTTTIDAKDIAKKGSEFFSEIGVVFQASVLDLNLSIQQNMLIRAQMYLPKREAVQRVHEMLELIGMSAMQKKLYRKLSGGERRKVDIAVSLLHRPSILFLDEPTTGVDVQSRREIWAFIHTYRAVNKTTIILTTHYLEEAETADYMVILNRGAIVAEGTPTELKVMYAKDSLLLIPKNVEQLLIGLDAMAIEYSHSNGNIHIGLEHAKASIAIVNSLLADIETFEVKIGKLEDVLMELIGQNVE